LAHAILKTFGNAITGLTLIPSGGGVFTVKLDDELAFSKQQEGRFPEDSEIISTIRNRLK